LASAEPTPGGGSAATIVGALGAALVAMVARITLGNPKFAPVAGDALMLVESADALRAKFAAARAADETAYAAVVAAQALPRTSGSERAARTQRLQAALTGAADEPLAAAALAADLIALCARAAALRNVHLMSDVECALAFGRAALEASAANVRINHRFMKDPAVVEAQQRRLQELAAAAAHGEAAARALIAALW
jgi:formiminotetrahydrofolate cyclodeaminase